MVVPWSRAGFRWTLLLAVVVLTAAVGIAAAGSPTQSAAASIGSLQRTVAWFLLAVLVIWPVRLQRGR